MHIPTYIHEQNAFPGVTDKMLEKHVEKVFLGFEEGSEYFRYPEKHVATGQSGKKKLLWDGPGAGEKGYLGFRKKDFVLLAFGGSQGAGRINPKATIRALLKRFSASEI